MTGPKAGRNSVFAIRSAGSNGKEDTASIDILRGSIQQSNPHLQTILVFLYKAILSSRMLTIILEKRQKKPKKADQSIFLHNINESRPGFCYYRHRA